LKKKFLNYNFIITYIKKKFNKKIGRQKFPTKLS